MGGIRTPSKATATGAARPRARLDHDAALRGDHADHVLGFPRFLMLANIPRSVSP